MACYECQDTCFLFMALEQFSGTKDKRPNIMTKNAPIALITQENPRAWGAVSHELGTKTNYVFLIISHNITGGQDKKVCQADGMACAKFQR